MRCMRKIDLAKRKEAMKDIKDDPILVHYDKRSDYTIPKIQVGMNKGKKRAQIEYSNEFKNRFTSLEQDTIAPQDIQKYMKNSRHELWTPKERSKEIERGIWNENYLKRLHETLKHFRRKKNPKRKIFEKCLLNESESPLTTLPTQALDDHMDHEYQDNTLIQKTIKGRAIQSMLQNGLKKVQDVIQEAKETHSISAVRKLFPKDFSQQIDSQEAIIREYNRVEEILKNDKKLQEELKKIESKDVRNMLNYFGKELNRLQNEKQSHALYLLAERERYRREAENLGEFSCEEQFKNDSVTLYLENILLEGINRAFDESSRGIIREMAQKIDCKASKTIKFNETVEEFPNESFDKVEELESSTKQVLQPDMKIVTELLIDNMIPQIMHKFKNDKLISQQREYLAIAHYDLYKEELEQAKSEEEQNICCGIFNEILENAMVEKALLQMDNSNVSRQMSLDAEFLASQIVEEILNDIISSDLDFSKCEPINRYENECEEEILIFKSETESSDDLLAEIMTHDVLNDIIECKTSSASEISDNSEFLE